jgi:hypothetical protein
MSYSKSIAVVFTAVVCATALAHDADAQARRGGGGSRGPSVGSAVQRGGGVRVAPRIIGPRGVVGSRVLVSRPFRSFYYPYRPGFSLAFYGGFGFGYPYGYYGYPYAYGYPYGAYGYPYGGYGGYGGYGYGRAVYEGGVRIEDAPRDAQVFVDGYYAGVVDDFDGVFQRLDMQPGPHQVEIRIPGRPPLQYDLNVSPGQTLKLHVR